MYRIAEAPISRWMGKRRWAVLKDGAGPPSRWLSDFEKAFLFRQLIRRIIEKQF